MTFILYFAIPALLFRIVVSNELPGLDDLSVLNLHFTKEFFLGIVWQFLNDVRSFIFRHIIQQSGQIVPIQVFLNFKPAIHVCFIKKLLPFSIIFKKMKNLYFMFQA